MSRTPGFRGPRTSTYTAVLLAGIKLDDRDARIEGPFIERRWFGGPFPEPMRGAADAVVDSAKPSGKNVKVSFQQKLYKETVDTGCTQSNHIHSIRADGSLEYEVNCTGSKTIQVDGRPTPFEIPARYAQGLQGGMPVAVVGVVVYAAWAKPGAATPSFGTPVK